MFAILKFARQLALANTDVSEIQKLLFDSFGLASFARQYLRILAGGGSKNPKKLLLEHGVDIDSRKFWQGGFDYVGEQISKLQTLL